jgi:hypothetical protein
LIRKVAFHRYLCSRDVPVLTLFAERLTGLDPNLVRTRAYAPLAIIGHDGTSVAFSNQSNGRRFLGRIAGIAPAPADQTDVSQPTSETASAKSERGFRERQRADAIAWREDRSMRVTTNRRHPETPV